MPLDPNPLETITEDHHLVEKARQNDMQAIAMIHDRYYPKIWGYVCYRVSDPQICEDITADVFMHLITHLKKKRAKIDHLAGWLMGTTHHLVMDHYREMYKKNHSDLDEHPHLPAQGSTHEDVELGIQHEQIKEILQELTSEQQMVITLRFVQDYSLEDTAQLMGRSSGAVKLLQFRAVRALRRQIQKRGWL